jgi:N-acetyl-gamma-glutamyl-phosphate reductase
MKKIGIVGGAGYTAGELIRILVNHPFVEIAWVYSRSQVGRRIADLHQDLWAETDFIFTDELDWESIDLAFLCLGHGESKAFLEKEGMFFSEEMLTQQAMMGKAEAFLEEMNSKPHIIDLSQDFRWGEFFTYGLPEIMREKIRHKGSQETQRIANPGCFATAVQLGLLPLADEGLLREAVHVNGITGSTGAGQSLTETSHFSWRNNNISVYKAFQHQHLFEITKSIRYLQDGISPEINFIPVRGNFTRGIMATLYTYCELDEKSLIQLYQDYYRHHPFVKIYPKNPHLKQVVNTNYALLHIEKHEDKILVVSMIDNLLKGASGQAVQNMNLIFDFEETTGLHLKAGAF